MKQMKVCENKKFLKKISRKLTTYLSAVWAFHKFNLKCCRIVEWTPKQILTLRK